MDDIKWFMAFLLVIGGLWLGGKSRGPAEYSPSSATTPPKSQALSPEVKGAPKKQGGATGARETTPWPPRGTIISETTLPAPVDPSISYLRGKMSIVSIRRNRLVNQEYVIVQASFRNTEDVMLTGLTLKSKVSFLSQEIPRAWSLPFPMNGVGGEVVMLSPGERAYIISGRSPNGQSFQLNKCTGYFEQGMNFVPPLPLRCPRPIDDPLPLPPNTLSDDCYDYLKRLGRCTVPSSSIPTRLKADGSCQAHIFNKISYNQCVTYYKNDRDFFQGEWRIYLGRGTRLWRDKGDIIELLDGNGRIIDRRSY